MYVSVTIEIKNKKYSVTFRQRAGVSCCISRYLLFTFDYLQLHGTMGTKIWIL